MRSGAIRRIVALKLAASALASLAVTEALAAPPEPGAPNPTVVTTDNLPPDLPAPAGALDAASDVTGIGQMAIDLRNGAVSVCTGTLINPRTVLFAAHCVNGNAAADYGSARGGIPISFGFGADNLPALLEWLGASQPYRSNASQALFNVEQVWYDPRSLALGADRNFLQADIALATLDTPATGIPTWALLFSPLQAQAHAAIVGYGGKGGGTSGDMGIDFRRRAAENMVSLLASLDDADKALSGQATLNLPQSLYQVDFDDPLFGTPQASPFDFNIFGGAALPREGITAGGDSGSPLIIDQSFSRPVVAGTLSGGRNYFPDQPSAGYGSTTFYQPLFLFWDAIVANNSYRYVTNKPGTGDWTDPAHWVQQMDPNYTIIQNGALKNGLPATKAQGVSGATVKFGQVCFNGCEAISSNPAAFSPAGPIAGGPGSTGFVPDNVTGTRNAQARYYDVTLAAAGLTRLSAQIEIDRLTIDGPTVLDVEKAGSLTVLGDFVQDLGWTNVDGTLSTGEALLVDGLLTGSGRFDPGYATFIRAGIAPAGPGSTGSLTIAGDVVLSSASSLFIDLTRKDADRLAIVADGDNAGSAALDGTVIFTPGKGPKPRYGQVITFLTAQGGVVGKFDESLSLLPGVLKANLSYQPKAVTATLGAGSLLDLAKSLKGVADEVLHFASALDALRPGSYKKLSKLYGDIDLMDAKDLTKALRKLAPKGNDQARALLEAQSDALLDILGSRLSELASGKASAAGLSAIGSPAALLGLSGGAEGRERGALLALSSAQGGRSMGALPEGFSGFVAFGTEVQAASASEQRDNGGLRSWQFAMGLERQLADRLTLGFAAAASRGRIGLTDSDDRTAAATRQLALYGSYRLGRSGYVAALASLSRTSSEQVRTVAGFEFDPRLSASPAIGSLDLHAEAGLDIPIGEALTLTPRAGIRRASSRIGAYRESGGEAALVVERQSFTRTESRIGLKLAGNARAFSGWSFRSHAAFDWVNSLHADKAPLTLRFAAAPDVPILLAGARRDRSRADMRGGVALAKGPLSIGLGFDASLGGSELAENRALLQLGLRF